MAYPNTSTVYGLAQVIQGEASNPNDQFGVASTIGNRLQLGGWGNSIASIVTPSQFNGGTTSTVPSASALQYAQAIFNGNLTSLGNTGNVTYYSASNFSTNPSAPNYVNPSMQGVAGAGNVLSPGGNSYATGTSRGPSVAGTTLPSLGTSTPDGGDYLTYNNDTYGLAAASGIGSDTPDITDSTFAGLTDADITGNPADAGSGAASTAASALPSDPATAYSGSTSNLVAALGAGGGTPVNITDLPGLDTSVTGAGKAVQTGAGTIASAATNVGKAVTGEATGVVTSLETWLGREVTIFLLAVAGLIMLGVGLTMFGRNHNPMAIVQDASKGLFGGSVSKAARMAI
jgi:hypothetical protein